ncbi:MAG TPA: ABC transporter ATP-binding protein [Candidatus Saccharimonadia bacterium]
MEQPLIQLAGVTKRYRDGSGEVLALKDINLAIAPNSKVVVMGPSGSGKSTLLQIIGGLDKASEGEVTVGGKALATLGDKELSDYRGEYIGFIFQTFNLQAHLSAEENVALPLILSGMGERAANEQARHALEKVGMAEKAGRFPAQLSGGEMQRVAIARAIVHNPKVILADEPTANLDKANAENVLELLKGLDLAGQALVIVTHDDRVAERFERVVSLDHGELVKDETKAQ